VLSLPANDYENKLIIDIDDTCIDTLTGFVKWLSSHGRLKNVAGNVITSREHLGNWLSVPDELADLWMKEFCEHSWQWGALYPMFGAEKALGELADNDWYIVGYSKSSKDMHRATLRRANLELLFPGVFNELYVVPRETNLYPMLKEHESAVCVTATESTARASAQAGHITYLLKQPWNIGFSDISVRKFEHWNDILQVLREM
jgi:hypothetical protein